MTRTANILEVNEDIGDIFEVRDYLAKTHGYPETYGMDSCHYTDMTVEVIMGKLSFRRVNDEVSESRPELLSVPENRLQIGMPVFVGNNRTIPEFDGIYNMTNVLVTYKSAMETRIEYITKVRDDATVLSDLVLVQKAEETKDEGTLYWAAPPTDKQHGQQGEIR